VKLFAVAFFGATAGQLFVQKLFNVIKLKTNINFNLNHYINLNFKFKNVI
jgi:hypothetical protein